MEYQWSSKLLSEDNSYGDEVVVDVVEIVEGRYSHVVIGEVHILEFGKEDEVVGKVVVIVITAEGAPSARNRMLRYQVEITECV